MAPPAVVLASGHLIDAPGRTPPRFPPNQVPRVTAQVQQALDGWGVGTGTTVVTGGARGADLIVAEQGLARGAQIVVCLALPQEEFERQSVELPDSDWAEWKLGASANLSKTINAYGELSTTSGRSTGNLHAVTVGLAASF